MNLLDQHASLRLQDLRQQYASGTLWPSQCISQLLARIDAAGRPEVWIARVPDAALLEKARSYDSLLQEQGEKILRSMPLFGIPFAVKDNIDVAGMPTTAGCPEFAYIPAVSATVVEKLLAAGAILVGKTNLDQFATGLVGARSPYGIVRNAIHPGHVSGGSSSGSAVSVALDLVSFALGTDTAGSGRVPAGLNNIVGLKPTPGLISTRGVLPACRTLDCVSVFAQSVSDAWAVTQVAAGYDEEEAYSRQISMLGIRRRGYRIAVPDRLEFFGDRQAQQAFEKTLARLRDMPGCEIGTVEFSPFRQAALLLYEGPWVAERLAAVGPFFEEKQDAMHPVVAGIIGQGKRFSAVDAFNGQYRLAGLRRQAELQLRGFDFMIVPTAPTLPTIAEVEREPVKRNSELGYYTNFVNFFDMAALSIPAMLRDDELPFGITLVAPGGADHRLAAAAQALLPVWQGRDADVQNGGTTDDIAAQPLPFAEPTARLAVVGAHLEGQPLNWQLLERGARKIATTSTSANYRLYALPGTVPPKPGLQRVAAGGHAIAVEVWEIPVRSFGEIVAEVPPPLAIGSLELADGQWVKGFLCEAHVLAGAEDISPYGGWHAYLTSPKMKVAT
jgi:allophanate hydrolase